MTDVSDEISVLTSRITTYEQEITKINAEVLQLEGNIEKTKLELADAQARYEKQQELLAKRVVAQYEGGQTVYLDVLLKAETIQQFISKVYYLTEILKHDAELVQTVKDQKESIALQQQALLSKQEQLKQLSHTKEKTNITLENTKAVRNSYLNQLTNKEHVLQEQLKTYEEEMNQLEQNILAISLQSLGDGYPGGQMLWPVPGYRLVTSPFGMRIHPIFGVQRLHTGTDIAAPLGTPAVAVNDGVVTLAKYSSSYGNYIMIDHGGGVVTLYAHASELCVTEGDIVKKGDVILRVGSTGWSTGPHLHFEVRLQGETVDAMPYITDTILSRDEAQEENVLQADNTLEVNNTLETEVN